MKTALLIMVAGIGSRFGEGIKQLEPVDSNNLTEIIETKNIIKTEDGAIADDKY